MTDQQYLLGKEEDILYKKEQAKLAKEAKRANSSLRFELRMRRNDARKAGLLQSEVITYGISKSKLKRLVEEGKIEKYQVGKRTYYFRDDVAEHL